MMNHKINPWLKTKTFIKVIFMPFKYILDPFKVIKEDKMEFFIWFVFTIFAGQLGILANIIIRYYTYSIPIDKSIYLDSNAGSFYTYAIAIAASALGPLFVNFIKNKKPEFTSLKITSIILIIFYLIISGIIYSAVQMKSLSSNIDFSLQIDWSQLIVYLIAIFIGLYTYCLLKISSPKYAHLDANFKQQDDEAVQEVVTESKNILNDGAGIKL